MCTVLPNHLNPCFCQRAIGDTVRTQTQCRNVTMFQILQKLLGQELHVCLLHSGPQQTCDIGCAKQKCFYKLVNRTQILLLCALVGEWDGDEEEAPAPILCSFWALVSPNCFPCSRPASEGTKDFSEQHLGSFSLYVPADSSASMQLFTPAHPTPSVEDSRAAAAVSRYNAITVRLGRQKRPLGFSRQEGGQAAAIKVLSCELNAGLTSTRRVLAPSDCEAEDRHSDRSEMYSPTTAVSSCCFSSS